MSRQIRYKGINHLAMVTADMDATIRFWRDFLGMRLVAGLGSKKYRHYFLEISATDMIAFFEWPERPSNSAETDRTVYSGEGKIFEKAYATKEPMP